MTDSAVKPFRNYMSPSRGSKPVSSIFVVWVMRVIFPGIYYLASRFMVYIPGNGRGVLAVVLPYLYGRGSMEGGWL